MGGAIKECTGRKPCAIYSLHLTPNSLGSLQGWLEALEQFELIKSGISPMGSCIRPVMGVHLQKMSFQVSCLH